MVSATALPLVPTSRFGYGVAFVTKTTTPHLPATPNSIFICLVLPSGSIIATIPFIINVSIVVAFVVVVVDNFVIIPFRHENPRTPSRDLGLRPRWKFPLTIRLAHSLYQIVVVVEMDLDLIQQRAGCMRLASGVIVVADHDHRHCPSYLR
jgi:hypothetical protein